jgi:hypothetical protein
VKRSKEEIEADQEEEDEFGYTTSEYVGCYVTVDWTLCLICMMCDASACRSVPFSFVFVNEITHSDLRFLISDHNFMT